MKNRKMMTVDETYGEFYLYTNADQWQQYLTDMAPEDGKAIRKMCDQIKRGTRIESFENAPSYRGFGEYVKTLRRMGSAFPMMLQLGNRSMKKYVEKLGFKNEKLRYFLTRIFGSGDFPALMLIMMMGWFHERNAGYLVGGSLPIAQRMTQRYRQLGGKLSLETTVDKILVEAGKATGVLLTDGTTLPADIIISAADGHNTLYHMLEGKYLSPKFEEAYRQLKLFTPFVQISFGIGDVVRSKSVHMGYWCKAFNMGNFTVNEGYSIMNQSQHDPTLAPAGKTSLVMRFNSPWDDWSGISGDQYKREKALILKDAIALLEKHYPGITPKIEVTDVSTPLTENRITGVWKGSYEGFLPGGNILSSALPDRLPGLKDFYMIGQWVNPGGGLPPAVQSGKWIIQTICRENHQKFQTLPDKLPETKTLEPA